MVVIGYRQVHPWVQGGQPHNKKQVHGKRRWVCRVRPWSPAESLTKCWVRPQASQFGSPRLTRACAMEQTSLSCMDWCARCQNDNFACRLSRFNSEAPQNTDLAQNGLKCVCLFQLACCAGLRSVVVWIIVLCVCVCVCVCMCVCVCVRVCVVCVCVRVCGVCACVCGVCVCSCVWCA